MSPSASRARGQKRKHERATDQVATHMHSFSVEAITGRTAQVPVTTYVDRASGDNRRHYRQEFPVAPPSPVKRSRAVADEAAAAASAASAAARPFEHDHFEEPGRYEMGFDADDEAEPAVVRRRKKFQKPAVSKLGRRQSNH